MTVKATDASFEQEVLKSDTPVLVDFWAEWCGPCKMIGPSLEDIAKDMDGKLKVWRSRTGGKEWEGLSKGLPQENCFVNVLRDAMGVDSLQPCGVYFGTTGGQVYVSANAGDKWTAAVRDLPPVLSVEVQTLP